MQAVHRNPRCGDLFAEIFRPVEQCSDFHPNAPAPQYRQQRCYELLGPSSRTYGVNNAEHLSGGHAPSLVYSCAYGEGANHSRQGPGVIAERPLGQYFRGARVAGNLDTYSKESVVDHYKNAQGLMPPERYLFQKYVRPGADVLDIGVGGGRTTEYLAPDAGQYLGIDYAPNMIEACRRRFPQYRFSVGDATNLSEIADASFDIVIFSFNGIDSIPTDTGRIAALREMARVVRPSGHAIISSHNARLLLPFPQFEGADWTRMLWRTARSVIRAAVIAPRALVRGHFFRGHGFVDDPVHGGLRNHVSTPASIARDAEQAGLRIVERAGAFHPLRVPAVMNLWDTYVLARR